ncbi:hypothetical protein ACO0OL_003372 [Hanseniaspora opuntiae]
MSELNQFIGDVKSGRLGNLSPQQEVVLKQVWVNILYKLGHSNLTLPDYLKVDSNDSSIDDKKTSSSGLGKWTGFGKKKTSTENKSTEFKIHDSLKPLPKEVLQKVFFSFLRADYPDNLLLRFVRARKWNLTNSITMILDTVKWRSEQKIEPDNLILQGEKFMLKNPSDIESGLVDKNLKLLKSVICGRDLLGRPIVLVRPKLHHAKDQTEEALERYAILIIESTRLYLREKNSIDQAMIIFDLTDFKTSNMDYAPVKFLIKCFEAHYPECLGKLLVHKAPWIFTPIWNIIKNWLDPVVADKISFSKNLKDLEKYISKDQIPQYLGGQSTFDLDKYPEQQVLESSLLSDSKTLESLKQERSELIKDFIQQTCTWVQNTDESKRQALIDERLKMSIALAENFKKMDPYVRNRGMYDVLGELQLE